MSEENVTQREETPEERVQRLQAEMINAAADGIQTVSVDGMTINNMTANDRKLAIDEAKKASLKKLPILFFKWR